MRFYTYAYFGKDGNPFFVGTSTGDGWKAGLQLKRFTGSKLFMAVVKQRWQDFDTVCRIVARFELASEALAASEWLAAGYRSAGFSVLTQHRGPESLEKLAVADARRETRATRLEDSSYRRREKQVIKSRERQITKAKNRVAKAKNRVAKAQEALNLASSRLAELERI